MRHSKRDNLSSIIIGDSGGGGRNSIAPHMNVTHFPGTTMIDPNLVGFGFVASLYVDSMS